MRILTIGGTVFLGRYVVAEALQRGHEVTVFTRGRENPALFPDAVHVTGDRRRDLDRLAGRTFDVVVDTCGYHPSDVDQSARALRAGVGRYVYISSTTVYRDHSEPGLTEDAPIHDELPDGEAITGRTLGPLKAACERAVAATFSADSLTIRCGRIVGPHDVASGVRVGDVDYDSFAGRFPYWPMRAARHDEFLAPCPADQPLQLLDVRDLAVWLVSLLEKGVTGVFNATGPVDAPIRLADLIDACTVAAGTSAGTPVWVDEDFLLDRGVRPGTELPLWTPSRVAARRGHYAIDPTAARAAGLVTRPLVETVRDVLAWAQVHPAHAIAPTSPVLSAEKERALLAAWAAR